MKKKSFLIFLTLIVISIIAIICININSQQKINANYTIPQDDDEILIINRLAMPRYSSQDTINSAMFIVEGVVNNVLDSTIEKIEFPVTNEIRESIVTDTEIEITNTIKGDITDKILVRCNIGKVDTTTLQCEEEAKFTKGEKVLLFLIKDNLSETYRLANYAYGKYVYSDKSKEYINTYSNETLTLAEINIS